MGNGSVLRMAQAGVPKGFLPSGASCLRLWLLKITFWPASCQRRRPALLATLPSRSRCLSASAPPSLL
jgi:hypothetical protein